MKLISAVVVGLISFQAHAGFSDLFKNPSEICTQEVVRHYGNSKDLIRGCQKHESKQANKCLDIIIRSNAQMHPDTTLICSYVNNDYATEAMEEFSYRYKLTVNAQVFLSLVDNQKEAKCIQNMVYANHLDTGDLQSCLDESFEEVAKRSRDTLGFSIANGGIADQARDFFGNLFN